MPACLALVLACLALPLWAFAYEAWTVPEWQSVPPDQRLFPEAALAPVLAFAEEQDTRALLLLRGGRLESQHQFGDWTAEKPRDLAADPAEQNDLAAQHPKIVARLMKQLQAWLQETDAKMPTDNPNYDPAKALFNARAESLRTRRETE